MAVWGLHVDRLTLCLWSRQMGSDGAASWAERAIIDLKNLLPIQNPKIRLRLIGSVEGGDNIFVTTDPGIYEVNLKSLQWKKLWKRENFRALIPYMSFYSPQGLQNDGDRKKLPRDHRRFNRRLCELMMQRVWRRLVVCRESLRLGKKILKYESDES